jgi:N-acetylmuramic acid 6-phosphate etherase
MSRSCVQRSDEFLKISGQFQLGALVTEASHPVTAELSDVARRDIAAALKLLFTADGDVVRKYREFAESGRAESMAAVVLAALERGGRIFFTGCGSTGRLSILLDSIWRDYWRGAAAPAEPAAAGGSWAERTVSVMAGGDYALIKSVEGFEDFAAFGKQQMTDLGVSARDVVFAITEGGETSFVIGTAWAGVAAGAKVYFVYNNPDEVLCRLVTRSREVIEDARIEKVNLTTGPMSITGSTRMQATSIQLCVMLTVLELAAQRLAGRPPRAVAREFLAELEAGLAGLQTPEFLPALGRLVALEETLYRRGGKQNYFASRLGIDVLTDTTERSPTYCTPPFRKHDDDQATESWAFLFVPEEWTDQAWGELLKRKPRCVEWREAEILALVGEDKLERTRETVRKISHTELMRYKIGCSGIKYRPPGAADAVTAVMAAGEKPAAQEFFARQLAAAQAAGARTSRLYFGAEPPAGAPGAELQIWVPIPRSDWLLDGLTRVLVKLVMNALSTCTMVRLGRVMGNYMVWVVPSNLKLIDRATRYITQLTKLDYTAANRLLFDIIAYVEPRMKADQAYPPVVGMAVLRAREPLTNPQAEARLQAMQAVQP